MGKKWEMKTEHFENTQNTSEMVIYTTADGLTKIETTFDGDTVWLSIDQMAELFQRDRSVIGKHIRNIFKEGELQKESVWAKFAYTASDGKAATEYKKYKARTLSGVERDYLDAIQLLEQKTGQKGSWQLCPSPWVSVRIK